MLSNGVHQKMSGYSANKGKKMMVDLEEIIDPEKLQRLNKTALGTITEKNTPYKQYKDNELMQ